MYNFLPQQIFKAVMKKLNIREPKTNRTVCTRYWQNIKVKSKPKNAQKKMKFDCNLAYCSKSLFALGGIS